MIKHIELDLGLAEKKKKAPLNKPFRLPKGSKKKFGVYVKNDKGNIVMVKFGDPNMSIKRDNPERRKAYRSRHGCDNPGPKWKANYWSCKMWSAKPVSKITGSCGKPGCGSVEDSEEITLEVMVQAKNKGLWHNIQQKKKRMGKNYRPAKPGSPNRPTEEAIKKAQGSDYENGNYEWDGETEFDQMELLKIDQKLAQAEEIEEDSYTIKENYQGCKFAVVDEDGEIDECFESKDKAQEYLKLEMEDQESEDEEPEEESEEVEAQINNNLKDYKEDFYGMIVGSINSIKTHAENILNKLNDPMVKENLTEPFLQQQAALAEDYMITIHNYVMFNKEESEAACACENEEYKKMIITEGQKLNDFLKQCIPTKQGDDKTKFKSCLEEYRNKK